ncbi:hypothetical protein JMUB5695_00692 [Mycobacterium heckeshornense]|nr:hypothetical protein JMUB5695_00692 [Mycobacterium heckeshornense]
MLQCVDPVPPLAKGLTWEDIVTGSAFRAAASTVTETDLMSFVHHGGFKEIAQTTEPRLPGRGVVASPRTVVNERGEQEATLTPVRLIRGRDVVGAGA